MHPIILELKQIADQGKFSGQNEPLVRIKLKEILQDYLLHAIYSSPQFNQLVFVGGTALRKLYSLNRMSEDLDFYSDQQIDLQTLGEVGINYFKTVRLSEITYSLQQSAHVRRITFKFPILNQIGLSPNTQEKLFVKVEIPLPVRLALTQTTLYSHKQFSIPIRHETLESLMAGKIIACLERVWEKGNTGIIIKGRDYYDLLWYMEQGIIPDFVKLKHHNPQYTKKNIVPLFDQKVAGIKSQDLLLDLQSLIEDYAYITHWCQNFQANYAQYRRKYIY